MAKFSKLKKTPRNIIKATPATALHSEIKKPELIMYLIQFHIHLKGIPYL